MLKNPLACGKEITALIGVERQVAKRLGLDGVANDSTVHELGKETPIDDVAQTSRKPLPSSG